MKQCKQPGCKFPVWRERLCYRHWRESQGQVFDPERKVFVKRSRLMTDAR